MRINIMDSLEYFECKVNEQDMAVREEGSAM